MRGLITVKIGCECYVCGKRLEIEGSPHAFSVELVRREGWDNPNGHWRCKRCLVNPRAVWFAVRGGSVWHRKKPGHDEALCGIRRPSGPHRTIYVQPSPGASCYRCHVAETPIVRWVIRHRATGMYWCRNSPLGPSGFHFNPKSRKKQRCPYSFTRRETAVAFIRRHSMQPFAEVAQR